MIDILQYPDSRLGIKADTVVDFSDKALQQVIDDMLETLHNTENCAGLAATQLNIPHPKRITVIYDYKDKENRKPASLCLVNPEIIAREGEFLEPEACMSVQGGVYEIVPARSFKVTVRAQDRFGNFFEIVGEGYMAKLLQHELDHLDGVIFIDRLSRLKRQRIDKKISKLIKRKNS
ncbi:MAG: peptide deformylase [Gammaproteobacteria bacterium]|nr:peptide deformylase [Gammaproteobacteria bacterium]